jgi:hypothetical protein
MEGKLKEDFNLKLSEENKLNESKKIQNSLFLIG